MIAFEAALTGLAPGLLMHNGRTANPMDPAAKNIEEKTKAYKKDKTDSNYAALARAEFDGGIYFGADEESGITFGPYLPQENIFKSLLTAGGGIKRGRGTLSKPIAAAVYLTSDGGINPIAYDGPRSTLDDLWDKGFYFQKVARVGAARIVRTRAHFKNWKCTVPGTLDTDILDFDDLQEAFAAAGKLVGLGDWRPEKKGPYGKFNVTVRSLGTVSAADIGVR